VPFPTRPSEGLAPFGGAPRRSALILALAAVGCGVASLAFAPASFGQGAPPPGPPSIDVTTPPPPNPSSFPPEGVRPRKAASILGRFVYLKKRSIPVPIKCKRSKGKIWLSGARLRLGSEEFRCDPFYRSVAKVNLKRKAVRRLHRKLSRRSTVRLKAKFWVNKRAYVRNSVVGSKVLRDRTKLKELRSPTRTSNLAKGLTWNRGELVCGRNRPTNEAHFKLYHPTISANGYLADGGFFNDTNQYNTLYLQASLYAHGAEDALDFGWVGPIYFAPYQTLSLYTAGFGLGDPPQGYDAYYAGASHIWWYNGIRDWNWVVARTPDLGYPTAGAHWCHVP
jgi:hypothetical protein